MFRDLKIRINGLPLVVLILTPLFVFGQDLGSSSKLFNNPKPKTAAKPPRRKLAPKPEKPLTAVRKKSIQKPVRNTAQVSSRSKAVNRSSATAEQKPLPTFKLIGEGGDRTKSETEELFERAIEEGDAARRRRQYAQAEAAYLRAQSLKAKDSRAELGLGALYSDRQFWGEAEQAYRKAIKLEPTAPEAYIALSYVLTQPIIGGKLGARYVEAVRHARRAVKLDPNNHIAYNQLGAALELSGEVASETLSAYRRAIELEPDFALAHAHLGRVLKKIGLEGESAASDRRAVELAIDAPTMIQVADVLQSQQRYSESERLLRAALKEDERNPNALFLLGRALTTRGKYDEAEKVLEKSAEDSSHSFVAFTLLGSVAARRERFDDAEKYLLQAARVVTAKEKKRLAQEFEAVGDALVRAGKNEDAVRVFEQAVALDKKKILAEKLAKARAS